MSDDKDPTREKAELILQALKVDFDLCHELLKDFRNVPNRPGIYAVRDREEILYIGRSANIRTRFQGGHKALGWALIDGLRAQDVRIATAIVEESWVRRLPAIEEYLLVALRPFYNVQYPSPRG